MPKYKVSCEIIVEARDTIEAIEKADEIIGADIYEYYKTEEVK